MTPSDFGRALNAAVLEVMPERHCSDCGHPMSRSGHTSFHPMEDKGGAVLMFWCETCDPKPKAVA